MATMPQDPGSADGSVTHDPRELTDLATYSTQDVLDSLDEDVRQDADHGDSDADDETATQDGTGGGKKHLRRSALVTRAKAVHDLQDKVAKKTKTLEERRAAQEKKPSGEAAEKVAKAEEDLKKAQGELDTAEAKLATAKKNALAKAEKEALKATKKQQRIELGAVDTEIAAQVVRFVLEKPEFHDRSTPDKTVWANSTPILNMMFGSTFKEKNWRSDFTTDEFITIYANERAFYIKQIRDYACGKSGSGNPDDDAAKVAEFHAQSRPSFQFFHDKREYEKAEIVPAFLISGGGAINRTLSMTSSGKLQCRTGGGVNMDTLKKFRPSKKAKTTESSAANEGGSDGASDGAASQLDTSNDSSTSFAPQRNKKQYIMKQMMHESREASAKDTRLLVHEMTADSTKLFTGIAERLAPAAPAAQDATLMQLMQKAQCDAQVSTTAMEMQKLAAHLEQQVEELTAWLEKPDRLQALVPLKQSRLAQCLAHLTSLNQTQ